MKETMLTFLLVYNVFIKGPVQIKDQNDKICGKESFKMLFLGANI